MDSATLGEVVRVASDMTFSVIMLYLLVREQNRYDTLVKLFVEKHDKE